MYGNKVLYIFIFSLFCLLSTSVFAGTITLSNPYDGVVYFLSLASNSTDYQNIQENPSEVNSIFSVLSSRIRYIPPFSRAYEVDTFDQATLIVGFLEQNQSVATPIFAFILDESVTDQIVIISEDFFLNNPSTDQQANFGFTQIPVFKPIKIDGAFLDWIDIDNLLSFSRDGRPISFRQSESDGTLRQNSQSVLSKSLFWQLSGTQVNEIAAIQDLDNYYFKITSFAEISSGTSYLLYVYTGDAENKYTLEVPVLSKSGPVVLWDATRLNPQLIGDFTTSNYGVEVRIDSQSLPSDFFPEDGQGPLIEFASSFFEGDVTEEFLLGTFNFSRIPRYDGE